MSLCGKDSHCCWFEGKVCEYLTTSPNPDYKYACSLKLREGTWERVHNTKEYRENVKKRMEGLGYIITDCGNWPPPDIACHTCGENCKK